MIPEKDLTEDLPVNLLTRDVNMIVLSKIDALLQTLPNSPDYSLSIHNGRHEGCDQPETMEHHLVACQNHVHQQLWNNLCHDLRIPTNQGRPTPTTARLLAFTLGKHATNPLTLSQRQATILRYIRDVYKHRFKTTNTE